eukprot:g3906.t1
MEVQKGRQIVRAVAKKGGGSVLYPFETDYNDHFETSQQAYNDIAPFLTFIAEQKRIKSEKLKIYDPYFCAGSMKQHLGQLGFENVYNENEDFYKVKREGKIPENDVIITNPPFSGKHKEKCLEFLVESGKPWLCLLPNYCVARNYFTKVMEKSKFKPFFAVPCNKYEFAHPEGTGKVTSPFESVWVLCFLDFSTSVIEWYSKHEKFSNGCGLKLFLSRSEVIKHFGISVKRPGPKKRRKMKKKKISQEVLENCNVKKSQIINRIPKEVIRKTKKKRTGQNKRRITKSQPRKNRKKRRF